MVWQCRGSVTTLTIASMLRSTVSVLLLPAEGEGPAPAAVGGAGPVLLAAAACMSAAWPGVLAYCGPSVLSNGGDGGAWEKEEDVDVEEQEGAVGRPSRLRRARLSSCRRARMAGPPLLVMTACGGAERGQEGQRAGRMRKGGGRARVKDDTLSAEVGMPSVW